MASNTEPVADQRFPLSRARVLQAAIALADAGGIEALSMRKLAQALGVEAMTLYYYVAKKDDILAAIVDLVVREFEAAIRASAISAHESLLRHPWAASLMLSGTEVSSARQRYMDGLLGCLRRAGFSAEMTDHAYHALDSHIMGFTLWLVGMDLGTADEFTALATSFLRELSRDEVPHLAEHIEQHLKPRSPDETSEFVFGLDLILDGLERLLPAE